MEEFIKKQAIKLAVFGSYILVACILLKLFKPEITINHKHQFDQESKVKIDHGIEYYKGFKLEHRHDFSGNLHTPITIQLSDPGYPIKFDVRGK